MSDTTRTTKEGRVNVPLGKGKERLKKAAKKEQTTETNFARVLLLDNLSRYERGEIKFSGPSVESAEQSAK